MKKLLRMAVLFAIVAGQAAAIGIYAKFDGAKSGQIKGEVTQKGREGTFSIEEFNYSNSAATGKRTAAPIVIRTRWAENALGLLNAYMTGELLKTVQLDFWQPNSVGAGGQGVEVRTVTLTLQNAQILKMEAYAAPISRTASGGVLTEESGWEITLGYQKATWSSFPSGRTVEEGASNASFDGTRPRPTIRTIP